MGDVLGLDEWLHRQSFANWLAYIPVVVLLAIIRLILGLIVPIRNCVCCFHERRAYYPDRLLHLILFYALAWCAERWLVFVDWPICVSIDLIYQKLLPLLLTSIEPSIGEFAINRAGCCAEVLGFLSQDCGLWALGRRATESLSTLTNAIRRSWFRYSCLNVTGSEVWMQLWHAWMFIDFVNDRELGTFRPTRISH